MTDETMEKIEQVKKDLEDHKAATDERFEALTQSIDDRLSRITRMAKGMLPEADQWDSSVTATPDDRYLLDQSKSALAAATNGFRFSREEHNPEGTFITMARSGRKGIIRFKRDVKGTPGVNSFVPAFPCWFMSTLNGREASFMFDNEQLPDVKRQYNFPAFDLEAVSKLTGLPSRLRDLKEFVIRANLSGDFYGSSGFLDLYLHNLDAAGALRGYGGTLNAIDGNFTKGININTWFKHPSEYNTEGPAKGWTGAKKIADKHIAGRNVEVAVKVETVNNNLFLYVAVVPESSDVIDYDVKAVTEWAEEDLENTLRASSYAMKMIESMDVKPVAMSNGLALCGGHLGSEFWYSRPGEDYDEMIFDDLEFRVNGVSHFLDGTTEINLPPEGVVVTRPAPPPVVDPVEESSRVPTRKLRLRVGETKPLPNSRGGGRITRNNKGLILNPTNSPSIMVKAVKRGDDIIEWTGNAGVLWSTELVIR